VTELPDLSHLSHDEKDALIRAFWAQVQLLTARVADLEAKLGEPPKTPDNSSVPPSQGKKSNLNDKPKRASPRKGGGRVLAENPDETVIARPRCCAHCQAAFGADDHRLAARYDKIDLPTVKPVVPRVEQYAGHCKGCGATTLAPLPEGLEPGSPFSLNIVALAIYRKRCSGTLVRSVGVWGRPVPRHQFIDAVLRPTVYESGEQVSVVGQRIDAVQSTAKSQAASDPTGAKTCLPHSAPSSNRRTTRNRRISGRTHDPVRKLRARAGLRSYGAMMKPINLLSPDRK